MFLYLGHQKYGTDVQGYKPLQGGSSCSLSTPPSCVASDIINLDWYLHGHHTYYINIKVANSAGLVIIQGSSHLKWCCALLGVFQRFAVTAE
jgi:hypothetical protein